MDRTTAVPFDSNAIGPSLALTDGSTTLQTSATVDAHRCARGQYGQNANASVVEFYPYSPNLAATLITAAPSLLPVAGVPPLTVGIVNVNAALNKYVGEDANGWGFCLGDGKLYNNGAAVGGWTAAPQPLGAYISVIVDFGALTATWFANGFQIGQITITAGAYFYAATVSGNPGDMAVWANAGQTPIKYLGSTGGWFHPRTSLVPIFIASEPYITASTDADPSRKYAGNLDVVQTKMSIGRGVMFWPWGKSAPPQLSKGGQIQFTINDPDEVYGSLLADDIRDEMVVFSRVLQGTVFGANEQTFAAIIDHCEQTSDQTKTLYCNGKTTLLQSQLVRPLFPPDAVQAVAGKPRPTAMGPCLTYTPPLYDAVNLYYACSDGPINQLGFVRDSGKQLALGVDFTMAPDAAGLKMTVAPIGKFTVESSTLIGTYTPTAIDFLNGKGNFSTMGALDPIWSLGSCSPYTHTPTGWQFTSGIGLHASNQQELLAWCTQSTYPLKPGRSYAFQATVTVAPSQAASNGWQPPMLGFSNFTGPPSSNIVDRFNCTEAKTYTGVFTTPAVGGNCPLSIVWFGAEKPDFPFQEVRLASLVMNELPPITQTTVLPGPTLDQILRNVLINHGPLQPGDYDPTGAQNIDLATGYTYGLYVSENESPSVADSAKAILNSCCADIVELRNGKVTAIQLVAPEDQIAIGSLTVTDMQSSLQPWPDLAENLATSIAGAKNYNPYTASDFQNVSQTDVPESQRRLLMQPFQWVAVGNTPVSPKYYYASRVSPLPSQLHVRAHGQAEANRVCALYAVARNFYTGTFFSPFGRQFEIGQIWNVTYPLETLKNGQNLMIVGLIENPSEGTTLLVFWGI